MPTRRLVGAGLAAAGVVGGVAGGRLLLRHIASPDVDPRVGSPDGQLPAGLPGELPGDVEVHELTMSDGARMRVLARGAGMPIVLVHGVTLSADVWYNQLRDLPVAGFRVVAPDLRGHGHSTVGTDGLHLDRGADDLAEILDRLDLRDAVLVGHSMGGMLALRLLTRDQPPGAAAPDGVVVAGGDRRVCALALVATSASPVVGRGVPGARAAIALAGPLLATLGRLTSHLPGPSLPDSDLGDAVARLIFGRSPAATDVRLVRRVTARVPAGVAGPLLAQLVSFDAEAQLDRVAVPTTVVVGDDDVLTPRRHAETLVGAITGACLVVLAGCGHMVMLERPAALAVAIEDLAGRAGRRS